MRRSARLAIMAAMSGVAACGDSLTEGTTGDANPPALDLAGVVSGVDTVLSFAVDARDNLGLKTISVAVTGGVAFTFDTTFTSAVTTITIPFALNVSRSVPAGTSVTIVGFATDGSGNRSLPDTLRLSVGNVAPPTARVVSPASGTVAIPGLSVEISLAGSSGLRVRSLGYVTSGVLVRADSTSFVTPLRDSATTKLLLLIPTGTPPGELRVTPFVYDSLNQRSTGSAIVLNVQTAASAGTVPTVSFGVTPRIEVTDTINVQASDPTGITSLGYEIRTAIGGPVTAGMADSVQLSGQVTSVSQRFTMRLPITAFPTRVFVQAFARNANGTRAYATLPGGAVRIDTVEVVAGATRPLPSGGAVADALYHPRQDRLYLTNIERNRVEVFAFADSAFKPGISVGSRPWGITPWPRDRNGTMGDTLLVANSGGTSISYVDVTATSVLFPSGRQVATYALPNIIAYSVTSKESATVPGTFIQERTVYDFSDRPQFVAATCRGSTAPGTPCGDVLLVYSTSPTGGQTLPFPNKGSIRWENLNQRSSHFFFEQAIGASAGRKDTLEVRRFAAAGYGSDSLLVPLERAIEISIDRLGFRDTTYVRNSGNFRRAVIGEGGPVLGSRAVMYDVTRGMEAAAFPSIDLGVSRAEDVTDFIANAFSRVKGAAINFDGELAAIRGDSTYLLDATLRLQGLFQTSGGNPGFDFHPNNSGNGTSVPLASCYSFAASSEPVIEVYENRHYARVNIVPIRDPIIGPIKAALRPNGEIVLVGATVRGVVIVTLPSNFVSGCP
ncbi:MAG: YncE family protein [Gemmatimonadaceae bacterium]